MIPVSVVIITKNEGAAIEQCLKQARLITNDIVVIDNNSTDQTINIAAQYDCQVYRSNWMNYGANKNRGIELARYDWILSLDADEVPDMDLILALHNESFDNENVVYDIKYQSYFGKKQIKFGRWGRDHHIRLFNRKLVKWSEPKVHEKLILAKSIKIQKLDGHLHHFSVADERECMAKAIKYARLSAESYFVARKKSSFTHLHLSPLFAFVTDYLFFLGFLDGKEGLAISKSIYLNKKLKYHYLNQLENAPLKKQYINSSALLTRASG